MRPPRNLKHSEIARELRSRWDPFPNVELLGSYSQFSQVIDLNSVAVSEVEAAYAGGDLTAKLKALPLLTHEFQHLIDHISTVWGGENLVSLFNAYNIRAQGRTAEYGRVADFLRKVRTYHYTDYYTEYSDLAVEPWDRKPWSYAVTMGFQLAGDGSERRDRPILFTRFATHDGRFLCRVPFSLSSLLEVNASYQELGRLLTLVEAIDDAGVRAIERRQLNEKWLERLYEPFSTVYTVAAHFVANRYDIRDALGAYQRAAVLTALCLNLPKELFPRLKLPEGWVETAGREPHEALRSNHDRGYLFAALVENSGGMPLGDPMEWLERVLHASNLPPVMEIKKGADDSFDAAVRDAIDGPARARLDDLLRLGDDYRIAANRQAEAAESPPDVAPPPVLTRDDKFVTFKGGPRYGSFSDPGDWHREAFRYHSLLEEFIEACVV